MDGHLQTVRFPHIKWAKHTLFLEQKACLAMVFMIQAQTSLNSTTISQVLIFLVDNYIYLIINIDGIIEQLMELKFHKDGLEFHFLSIIIITS